MRRSRGALPAGVMSVVFAMLIVVVTHSSAEAIRPQQVAAGDVHTVGVKSDGTVVAVGEHTYGQCNVGGWTGIVQVAAGDVHTVGLRRNRGGRGRQ